MAKKTMDDQNVKNLERHSQMLGQIATEVEEFCICDESSTTLDGVLELKARYYEAEAKIIRYRLERKER